MDTTNSELARVMGLRGEAWQVLTRMNARDRFELAAAGAAVVEVVYGHYRATGVECVLLAPKRSLAPCAYSEFAQLTRDGRRVSL